MYYISMYYMCMCIICTQLYVSNSCTLAEAGHKHMGEIGWNPHSNRPTVKIYL